MGSACKNFMFRRQLKYTAANYGAAKMRNAKIKSSNLFILGGSQWFGVLKTHVFCFLQEALQDPHASGLQRRYLLLCAIFHDTKREALDDILWFACLASWIEPRSDLDIIYGKWNIRNALQIWSDLETGSEEKQGFGCRGTLLRYGRFDDPKSDCQNLMEFGFLSCFYMWQLMVGPI